MFFSLLKFYQVDTSHSLFFTNSSVELFPSSNITISEELNNTPTSVSIHDTIISAIDIVPDYSFYCFYSVRTTPVFLHDYHCYSIIATLKESRFYCEANTNSFWQQAMTKDF